MLNLVGSAGYGSAGVLHVDMTLSTFVVNEGGLGQTLTDFTEFEVIVGWKAP